MEKYSHEYLKDIANDYDLYCDFFGGRNLESKEQFESDDLQERINYLIKEFGE